MEKEEFIRDISLTNFNVYRALSSGYDWVSPSIISKVRAMNEGKTIDNILTDKHILNYMGIEMINMPYTENTDGTWSFKPPVFIDTDEKDIKRTSNIGKVYKHLIAPIKFDENIFFTNNTRFILYNDKIEISDERNLNDVNIVNILVNVISIFIVQTYKRKVQNG